MKPIVERSVRLVSHRNLTGVTMGTTRGKNGVPPMHAVGSVPPTRSSKVMADAIIARTPTKDRYGIDYVLRHGINSDVDSLAVQHELDQANLEE